MLNEIDAKSCPAPCKERIQQAFHILIASRTALASSSQTPGWPGCPWPPPQPAPSAATVSVPTTEIASGKLLAPKTTTGPIGINMRRTSGLGVAGGQDCRVNASIDPRSFPNQFGKQACLAYSLPAFTSQSGHGKPSFLMSPFQQSIPKRHDFISDEPIVGPAPLEIGTWRYQKTHGLDVEPCQLQPPGLVEGGFSADWSAGCVLEGLNSHSFCLPPIHCLLSFHVRMNPIKFDGLRMSNVLMITTATRQRDSASIVKYHDFKSSHSPIWAKPQQSRQPRMAPNSQAFYLFGRDFTAKGTAKGVHPRVPSMAALGLAPPVWVKAPTAIAGVRDEALIAHPGFNPHPLFQKLFEIHRPRLHSDHLPRPTSSAPLTISSGTTSSQRLDHSSTGNCWLGNLPDLGRKLCSNIWLARGYFASAEKLPQPATLLVGPLIEWSGTKEVNYRCDWTRRQHRRCCRRVRSRVK